MRYFRPVESDLVSIIVPVYRQSAYVPEAIASVMAQDHRHWELLVISDGPDPELDAVMAQFNDPRIRYFNDKPHGGVGHTRNYGLEHSKGGFWLFLDADDALPPSSISSRMERFAGDSSLRAVDGWMELSDDSLTKTIGWRRPDFEGEPLNAYLNLDERVFTGIAAMVRREKEPKVWFDEGLTHSEDLLFYIDVFRIWGGRYTAVQVPVYRYRRHAGTAMGDLVRLEAGYRALLGKLRARFPEHEGVKRALPNRIRRIMVRSYLKRFKLIAAMRAFRGAW